MPFSFNTDVEIQFFAAGGCSERQIARLLGLTRYRVRRALGR